MKTGMEKKKKIPEKKSQKSFETRQYRTGSNRNDAEYNIPKKKKKEKEDEKKKNGEN